MDILLIILVCYIIVGNISILHILFLSSIKVLYPYYHCYATTYINKLHIFAIFLAHYFVLSKARFISLAVIRWLDVYAHCNSCTKYQLSINVNGFRCVPIQTTIFLIDQTASKLLFRTEKQDEIQNVLIHIYFAQFEQICLFQDITWLLMIRWCFFFLTPVRPTFRLLAALH
uniref:Secreted protein n=1 Tax=Heterorhabditis bacteriophora TaxID=37862 RepID=A0A1I7WDW5_HETBA